MKQKSLICVQTSDFASPTRNSKIIFVENPWIPTHQIEGLQEIFQNQIALHLVYLYGKHF